MICVCDTLSASLISSLVLLCASTFFYGIGEFGYAKGASILVLRLNLTGFLLVLNAAIFSILVFIFRSSVDLFKLLVAILIYDVLAIIFMISGWNQLLNTQRTSSYTFYMLLVGFIFAIIALIPILLAICYSKRILFFRR